MLESKGMLDGYPTRENPQAEARLLMVLSLLNRNRDRQRISSPKSYDSGSRVSFRRGSGQPRPSEIAPSDHLVTAYSKMESRCL